MKILKYMVLSITALVVIVLVITLILTQKFHAGSQIHINHPSAEVFTYVYSIKIKETMMLGPNRIRISKKIFGH